MGLPTLFIALNGFMQLVSIWANGPNGHSLVGWILLLIGLMLITIRSHKEGDDSAFWSFYFQSGIVGLIVVSIIYLRGF